MTDLPRKPKQEESERTEAPPRTPAELRAYADRREAEATEAAQAAYDLVFEKCMVEVQRIRQAADVVERLGEMTTARKENLAAGGGDVVSIGATARPESPELNLPLPPDRHSGINNSMNSIGIDSGTKKRKTGPPLKSKGPVAKVAKALGISIAEVADRVQENVHSMRTWDQRNQVPVEVQAKLADLLPPPDSKKKPAR